jgi:hypothetical protein
MKRAIAGSLPDCRRARLLNDDEPAAEISGSRFVRGALTLY